MLAAMWQSQRRKLQKLRYSSRADLKKDNYLRHIIYSWDNFYLSDYPLDYTNMNFYFNHLTITHFRAYFKLNSISSPSSIQAFQTFSSVEPPHNWRPCVQV